MDDNGVSGPNDHCFLPPERAYWEAKARGFSVGAQPPGAGGADVSYAPDNDGFAMQNGGMHRPMEVAMRPGVYYRFFSTKDCKQYTAQGCMTGEWWLEGQDYYLIRDAAEAQGKPMSQVAKWYLAIPEGWHDCGFVGRANLTRKLKAFVGKGKPATNTTSPHNAQRNPETDPLVMPPGHVTVKQWFVPGGRKLIGTHFVFMAAIDCKTRGKRF